MEEMRERINVYAADVAAGESLNVWDLKLWRGPRGWIIKVILDRADGLVDLESCGRVNRKLRGRLELEGTLAGDFDMEVSSPGLDRSLRTWADVERFRGHLARLKVRSGLTAESVVGRIVGVDAGVIELDTDAGRRRVEYAAVAEARLEPELPGYEKKTPPVKKKRAPRK